MRGSLLLCAAAALCALQQASARHRLEPPDGRLLHAGGQEPGCFESYSAFLGARGPSVKMAYAGLEGLNGTAPGAVPAFFTALASALAADAAPDGAFIALQLGLQLPLNGQEARVAAGEYDAAIEALRAGLVALQRPVWLRIGYEFNGQWNNYAPASFVGAFRRVAAALRADALLNQTVALVWDGSCDTRTDPTPFWPGADVVDWQGINLFSAGSSPASASQRGSCPWYWLQDSLQAGLPLMVGESTPRGLNTSDPATLGAWHAPYAALLQGAPNLKLFSYIDQDWEVAEGGRWRGWGEARVEVAAPALQAQWRALLGRPALVNRAQRSALLAVLGLPENVFEADAAQRAAAGRSS
jgi:hypothetical protein